MRTFNSRTALAAATLTAGQLVMTKGLSAPGDGGHQVYLITTGASPDDPTSPDLVNAVYASLQYAPVQSVVAGTGIDVFITEGRLTIAIEDAQIWGEEIWDDGATGEWSANGLSLEYQHAATGTVISSLSGGISGHDNENIELTITTNATLGVGTLTAYITTSLGNDSASDVLNPLVGDRIDLGGGLFQYGLAFDMSSVNGLADEINITQTNGNAVFTVTNFEYV